ncbi:hypothetical protein FVEG_16875 [Fusarium verticillioides 7600]|uniref:NADP-dependent oxidoreductase domain-containing protein n=1 Tax=Gibberella moniliformis (strain M3125 / FGSC 7600) TaxID=334819 RepID=W7MKH1_GIBM7|nr:hypothetical protein FVEG_16875 [Fusarium verticillioides 7600]EWG51868.1 hypothetical protein FVEG_16875 [Fusarium verticillioides 7600]
MDILVYNPLTGGVLSGRFKSKEILADGGRYSTQDPVIGVMSRDRYFKNVNFAAFKLIQPVADKLGLTLLEIAFRWLLHHSKLQVMGGNDGLVIGISSLSQLESSLDNVEKAPLPEKVLEVLDEAWKITKPSCSLYWRESYQLVDELIGTGSWSYMSGCGLVIISVDKLILLQVPDYFTFLLTSTCLAHNVVSDLLPSPQLFQFQHWCQLPNPAKRHKNRVSHDGAATRCDMKTLIRKITPRPRPLPCGSINPRETNGCFDASFPGGSCTNDPACMCTQKKYREAYFCCMAKKCDPDVMPESVERQHTGCQARNLDFTFDAEKVCGMKLDASSTSSASSTMSDAINTSNVSHGSSATSAPASTTSDVETTSGTKDAESASRTSSTAQESSTGGAAPVTDNAQRLSIPVGGIAVLLMITGMLL